MYTSSQRTKVSGPAVVVGPGADTREEGLHERLASSRQETTAEESGMSRGLRQLSLAAGAVAASVVLWLAFGNSGDGEPSGSTSPSLTAESPSTRPSQGYEEPSFVDDASGSTDTGLRDYTPSDFEDLEQSMFLYVLREVDPRFDGEPDADLGRTRCGGLLVLGFG